MLSCVCVCVKFVCVKLVCVSCMCKEAGGGRRRRKRKRRRKPGIQNQKQEPHTKMWGKTAHLAALSSEHRAALAKPCHTHGGRRAHQSHQISG